MYDEVLERNEDGQLEVRVVQSSGDTNSNADDVFTRDDDGKLALRVTGVGGGGGGTGDTYTKSQIDAKVMALQEEIDTNAGKTAELDADVQGKVDKAQGTENAGKFLTVGEDGNVTLSEGGGGVSEVVHDDTLTGNGTSDSPLSVAKPTIIIRRF